MKKLLYFVCFIGLILLLLYLSNVNVYTDENWILFFSGLTAFGTVGAVIVSLWLAFKKNTPALRVRASKRIIIDSSVERPEFLVLEVTNTGNIAVNIIQFMWKMGVFKPNWGFQVPDNSPHAIAFDTKLPKFLVPGDQAKWLLRYDSFWKDNVCLFQPRRYSFINKLLPFFIVKKSWKIGVATTVEKNNYWATIDRSLQDDIIALLREKKSTR